MTIQYLTAEKQATQYYFKVWMDNTKFEADGTTPDPNYIKEYSWSLSIPQGQTEQQYLDQIKTEITWLVDYELNQMQLQTQQQPTPLAGF